MAFQHRFAPTSVSGICLNFHKAPSRTHKIGIDFCYFHGSPSLSVCFRFRAALFCSVQNIPAEGIDNSSMAGRQESGGVSQARKVSKHIVLLKRIAIKSFTKRSQSNTPLQGAKCLSDTPSLSCTCIASILFPNFRREFFTSWLQSNRCPVSKQKPKQT